MSKRTETSDREVQLRTFRGESSNSDKGALICDLVMLCIFLWNQIRYGMNMLFLIIPLALLGVYLALYCVWPEEYCFTERSLTVRHKFRKSMEIPYEAVFNYEASSKDSFINIHQSNRVKIYYTKEKKKKAILCMPKDVASFVDTLKWNCPEFHEDPKEKSKLDVFFDSDE